MSLYTLVRANWIDLLSTLVILKITYNGSMLGVGKQILPFLSLLLMLAISLYFYSGFGLFLADTSGMPRSVGNFIAFMLILTALFLINRSINRFLPLKRPEGLVRIERIAGLVLGFLNAIMMTGLIFVTLFLTPVEGLESSLMDSVSGKFIVKQCLNLYAVTVNFIKGNKDFDQLTPSSVFSQLTIEKDYKLKLFNFDLKEKSRFHKESEAYK